MALKVSSWMGPRVDPVTKKHHNHSGIDLPAPTGTAVFACRAGTVLKVDQVGNPNSNPANGNAVHIRDMQGNRWSYLHLSRVNVRAGQTVPVGIKIGEVGSTGWSTGPHLHLQVSDAQNKLVDPVTFFPAGTFYGR